MRHYTHSSLILLLLLLPFFVFSQAKKQPKKSSSNPSMNVIKINPASLLGGLSLSYERAIWRGFSINLQGYYLYKHSLPQSWVDNIWRNDATENQKLTIGKPRFTGFGLTPEIRYYFLPGQSAPEGLYAALYLRMWQYNASMDVTYINPNLNLPIDTFQLTGKLGYYAIRPGLQLGYNWIIADHLSLDAFVGANYGVNGVTMQLRSPVILDLYDAFIDDFVGLAGEQGYLVQKAAGVIRNKFSKQADRVFVGGDFALPGFRGGLTLGFAF